MCQFPKEIYAGLPSEGLVNAWMDKDIAFDVEASDMCSTPSKVKVGIYKLVRVEERLMDEQ